MNKAVATIVVALALATGPFHVASMSMAEHFGHGVMASSACAVFGCDTPDEPADAAGALCLDHCLSAANGSALPGAEAPFSVLLLAAFAVFSGAILSKNNVRKHIAFLFDFLQKALVHERLASVVLRN